jgi:hypothetical protein
LGVTVTIGLILGVTAIPAVTPRAQSVDPPKARAPAGGQDATDVLGANAACLVCHLTFVKEQLVRGHQVKGVACTKCHGPSVAHANDEHIGATEPDVVFSREQVDSGCAKCHKNHDVPARNVVERFLERNLPAKRAAICTDCHGTHRIEKAAETPSGPSHPPERHDRRFAGKAADS